MATVVLLPQQDPEEVAENYLAHAPYKYLACRGFGHAFPKPPVGRKKSKHFILSKEADGWQTLRMTCRDCGTVRWVVAEPGARIQLPAKRYNYDRPAGYSVKGGGGLLTRSACAQAAVGRWEDEQEHPTGGEDMELSEERGRDPVAAEALARVRAIIADVKSKQGPTIQEVVFQPASEN